MLKQLSLQIMVARHPTYHGYPVGGVIDSIDFVYGYVETSNVVALLASRRLVKTTSGSACTKKRRKQVTSTSTTTPSKVYETILSLASFFFSLGSHLFHIF